MKYLTLDLEVENHKLNKRTASPFDERNYIVQIGWSINGGAKHEKYYTEIHREPVLPCLEDIDVLVGFNIKFDLLWVWEEPELKKFLKRGGRIYCGQYMEYLLGGMTQDVQMCSMNQIAESYGGGCKIDAVKEMWENGALTSEIPRDLLTDYLIGDGKDIVGDVHNTWLIFLGQMKRVKEEMAPEFLTMYNFRMDGYLATCEIEFNGMYVDKEHGEVLRSKLAIKLDDAIMELDKFIPELPPEFIFNWGSPLQKSCLIFGGTARYKKWARHEDDNGNPLYSQKTVKWPLFTHNNTTLPVNPKECTLAGELYVIEVPEGTDNAIQNNNKHYIVQNRFKGGKNAGRGKTKNVKVDDTEKPKGAIKDFYFTFDGYTSPRPHWKGDSTDAFDNPVYSTAADIIEEIGERGLAFTDALIVRTRIAKDLSSYYWTEDKNGKRKGMLTLVGEDNIIHHKLNLTSTVTSRMSSSDPNLQTLPRKDLDGDGVAKSEVKQMFKSRFGIDGRISETDYSQLEVVVMGVLSRDKNLMRDLNNKIDFHCKRLSMKLGRSYDDVWNAHHVKHDAGIGKGRTQAKIISFQRAYGAGAAKVAQSTGMSKDEVEQFIEAENKLYPTVVEFDKQVEREIVRNRIQTDNRIFVQGIAFKQGEAHWDSPTGTRYIWREHETPEFMHKHGKYVGFSPTERKNYPVQGFGGEIMQTMLGKLFRYFIANDNFGGRALLVNSVHDCVQVDGHKDVIQDVTKNVQRILETVPEVFNKAYPELNIEVPFPAEAEIGRDLFDMKLLH